MPVFLAIAACCAAPLALGVAMVFKSLRSVPETGISHDIAKTPGKQSGKLRGKPGPARNDKSQRQPVEKFQG